MAVAKDRPKNIPAWVGARTRTYRTMTVTGVSPLKTETVMPPMRGRLYTLLTKRTGR
ncbi:hypothetical protein [Streptomyces sp. ADI98-10]|uniref:hypothetical protein n=1 Tax=Streptomyces sp. ADI98-10 TaxID=1522763 RepID=UPI000F92F716|nr:hypothetical protein [Streptomyces sp. ADI98-10]RPK85077.1 hypothetical protein EES46_23325 [Streptomyces sp. ADI98-10]